MEGVSFEAAELAAVWKLGKIIYFFDSNNISIDGAVDKVSVTNQKDKFESLGWHVIEIDGHNEKEIINSVKKAKKIEDKPSLIIAKTTIGKFAQKEQKELDESMKESFRQRDERKQADKKKISEGYKKLAEVTKQVGNLQVQNTDYQQIVQELSDKLKQYENKYGTVFTKGSSNKTE